MSHFLCLSTPPQISDEVIACAFSARVRFTPASDCFIGALTRGKQENWSARIFCFGSDSFALFHGEREILTAGLQTLLRDENCREVRFMAHLFTGSLRDETFALKRQERVFSETTKSLVENIELDVRYVIATPYFWEQCE